MRQFSFDKHLFANNYWTTLPMRNFQKLYTKKIINSLDKFLFKVSKKLAVLEEKTSSSIIINAISCQYSMKQSVARSLLCCSWLSFLETPQLQDIQDIMNTNGTYCFLLFRFLITRFYFYHLRFQIQTLESRKEYAENFSRCCNKEFSN